MGIKYQFQTHPIICDLMASLIPESAVNILEPIPGIGNLVKSIKKGANREITAPDDFFDLDKSKRRFDCIVMNPPFTPMKKGYEILYNCMEVSDNIIALMPYLTIINSEKRTKDIANFGLKCIIHLPRSAFKGSRVQTCILQMQKGYIGGATFKIFDQKFT